MLGTLLMVCAFGVVSQIGPAWAAAGANLADNTDYSGTPPSLSTVVVPNVLFFADMTSTMTEREYLGIAFTASATFSGLFDPMKCYDYDSADGRFEPASPAKASISATCPGQWDGNFLNWVALRRADAAKKAMGGGTCVGLTPPRDADGNCLSSGSPSLPTITHQTLFGSVSGDASTGAVLFATYNGRVGLGSGPANLYFYPRGSGSLAGWLCVDDDATTPSSGASSCSDADAYAEGQFRLRVALESAPRGVLQDFAGRARFGLMQFGGAAGTDIEVLVPIGSRQSRDFTGTIIETSNTNTVAMVDALDELFHKGQTPLAEAMYEAIRYFAQLPSAYNATTYAFPLAYSPAVGLGQNGVGSMGNGGGGSPPEESVLTGADTCPAGYIASACGRDPYFFGSKHSPAWASPSAPVTCCKSFVILFSDGRADMNVNLPANAQGLKEIAAYHPYHGTHCTGSNTADPPSPLTTCSQASTLDGAEVLSQHKTDRSLGHWMDELAYWAHTTDLRQATIPVINEAGHDLAGFQNLTFYTFQAAKDPIGRDFLMHTALAGGFEDANGNNLPDNGLTPAAPCSTTDLTQPCEWDKVINATGAAGRDNIPDTFFAPESVDDIANQLTATLGSILQKASSGTSVSVLATSATGAGAVYQAYFFPATFVHIGPATSQVLWTGFTQGLFIDKFGNLREDYSGSGCTGLPDGKLVLTHDCIIKVRLETDPTSPNFNSVVADRFKDDGTAPGSVAGDAVADTTTPFQTVALTINGVSNAQPLWEGGRRLALLSPGATCESSTTWPIAGNMSQGGNTCRRILTWADLSNGGDVGGGAGTETLEFSTANAATLCPYLGGSLVLNCNSSVAANKTAAQNEATNIITWIRGSSVSGLRDRTFNVVNDSGTTVQAQWKLGDVINSSPIVVGAPKERYDVIYGDATYASYFQRYKDRRQVAYVGANDGMLHAFNAGFFRAEDSKIDGTGPNVQVRFTTTPKQAGSSTNCAALPCDAAVTTYSFRADAPPLGAELWGYVPQDLLPQLRWMTLPNYDHMYYVDLTPKVTDVRIFTPDADHPGGWGTILIGGFRLGGSCTECTSGKGTPRAVQADFNYNGTTTDTGNGSSGSDYRMFLSSYFVMDITNPEKEPTLLWVFRDDDLGLTTAAPAVLRVNPTTDAKTSSTNEKWYVVFGTGPTHHDGFSTQDAQIYVVDLKLGPAYVDINRSTGNKGKGKKVGQPCPASLPCISADTSVASAALRVFNSGITGAFMADAVTLDSDLDFRVDVVYAGSVICNGTTTSSGCGGSGPVWRGAMWRLTTNGGDTNPDTWGISSGGNQVLTTLISTFAYTSPQATTCAGPSPCKVGPIATAPALTKDDTNNIWLFFGTGRYSAVGDKTNMDIQHFFGVKDSFITSGSPAQTTERNNLFNSSNVVVCSSCASGSNVSTTGSTSSFTTSFSVGGGNLVSNVQNMDGWFTTFNDPTAPLQTPPRPAMTLGERNLSSSTLIGGTVFFTTFIPSTDICAGSGTGQLYAVFYLTGGPYTASAIGTAVSGSNTLTSKSLSLGQGLPSQMGIQIGAQGSGTSGSASSSGCAGRLTGFIQANGALSQTCSSAALSLWSRMVAWRDL
jgi:type IV pilus assembly protein PilY1